MNIKCRSLTPHSHTTPSIIHLSHSVRRGQNITIPYCTIALFVLRSCFIFPLLQSLYPAMNTTTASCQSCHTKREISFPFSTQRNMPGYIHQIEFPYRHPVALSSLIHESWVTFTLSLSLRNSQKSNFGKLLFC